MAHQCTYGGRHFVHITMRKGSDVISLVIARKNDGETFRALVAGGERLGRGGVSRLLGSLSGGGI